MGPSVIFFPTCIDAFPNQKWGLIFPHEKRTRRKTALFPVYLLGRSLGPLRPWCMHGHMIHKFRMVYVWCMMRYFSVTDKQGDSRSRISLFFKLMNQKFHPFSLSPKFLQTGLCCGTQQCRLKFRSWPAEVMRANGETQQLQCRHLVQSHLAMW